MDKPNPLKEKSYSLAIRIIKLAKYLRDKHREPELAERILTSGTAIGMHVEAAESGRNATEFQESMSEALRSVRISHYWIRLLRDTGHLEAEPTAALLKECEELGRFLAAIVKTTQTH